MYRLDEDSIIDEIKNEYKKIDDKWLKLHYHTFVGVVLFGLFGECTLGVGLYFTGITELSFIDYLARYVLFPLTVNSTLVAIGILAMHYLKLSQKAKVYLISTLFVGVCFIFYTVHIIFGSLYMIFTAPILMTVVYSDYFLTSLTAFICVAAKIAGELLIVWDSDKLNPFLDNYGTIDFWISLCMLGAFYLISIIVIRFGKEKNSASLQKEFERYQMQQRLITDDLTDIYNRIALRNAFQTMETDTSQNTYSFVMIDLDNFKALNDTLGHDKGDNFLKDFGRILAQNCNDDMVPFRFGGDEFCILFRNHEEDQIIDICKRIQTNLKDSPANPPSIQLTASVGIAHYHKQMPASRLLKNTDLALYRSKEAKDAICVYEDFTEKTCPKHSGERSLGFSLPQ